MALTISITDQDIFTALRTFLIGILPTGTEVVQAQDNRVSMPKGGFVSMNNVGQKRLSFNVDSYNSTLQTKDILTPTQYTIQLDFYGPLSAEWAAMTQSLFRDEYSTTQFPVNIQPLYADDPIQMPLIDGEQEYEQRWKLQTVMQFNPVIEVTQQSATALNVTLADVDVVFPPV